MGRRIRQKWKLTQFLFLSSSPDALTTTREAGIGGMHKIGSMGGGNVEGDKVWLDGPIALRLIHPFLSDNGGG